MQHFCQNYIQLGSKYLVAQYFAINLYYNYLLIIFHPCFILHLIQVRLVQDKCLVAVVAAIKPFKLKTQKL